MGGTSFFRLYPELFDAKQSAELPAETMYAVKQGDDCGWPYVYYDQFQKEKKFSPPNMVEMARRRGARKLLTL